MSAPTMTRGHFHTIAVALLRATPLARDGESAMRQWRHTVYLVADALTVTNGRFDKNRFLRACGVES